MNRTGPGSANFTGAFVGIACQDMSGTAHPADFDYFEYRERELFPALVVSRVARVFGAGSRA